MHSNIKTEQNLVFIATSDIIGNLKKMIM